MVKEARQVDAINRLRELIITKATWTNGGYSAAIKLVNGMEGKKRRKGKR